MGSLLGLEEENCAVAEVKVDEVFGLMGNKGSEIPADNAVPSWAFSLIELKYIRLYVV